MKQLKLIILFLVLGMTAASCYANSKQNNNLYSQRHPLVNTSAPKPLTFPSTDITINNATRYPIQWSVVDQYGRTVIDDYINGFESDHVRNNGAYNDWNVVLRRSDGKIFFNQFVCRLAVITVMENAGHFSYRVDTEYCH